MMRGYLVIYVDGYKYRYKNLVHVFTRSGETISVPDRLFPPEMHVIDSMKWWEEGWAVGDNSRDRLCGRDGQKQLKKFHDFDEAVRFAFARQRKNKSQQHILVYVNKDELGRVQKTVVHSKSDIAAVDAVVDKEAKELEIERGRLRIERERRYPELNLLEQKFGRMKAWRLADSLAELRERGYDHVRASMKRSSWYKFVRELREVGVEIPLQD